MLLTFINLYQGTLHFGKPEISVIGSGFHCSDVLSKIVHLPTMKDAEGMPTINTIQWYFDDHIT